MDNTAEIRQRFGALMAMLSATFNEPVTEPRVAAYFEVLKALSIEEVESGVKACLAGCRFFPKPADILEAVNGNAKEREATLEAQAAGAWAVAFDECDHAVGRRFEDSTIHHVVKALGGWVDFSNMTEEEVPFVRKDFIRLYLEYAKRPPECEPPALLGLYGPGHFIKCRYLAKSETKAISSSNRALKGR